MLRDENIREMSKNGILGRSSMEEMDREGIYEGQGGAIDVGE